MTTPLEPSNITFVSSFIDIYDKPYVNKNYAWRFSKFRELAETGIQLCVYVNIHCIDLMTEMAREFPNIIIMKIITIEYSWIGQLCDQYDDIQLPANRNKDKDTREYMILMNSKAEYMYDAAIQNPWNSTHFAWVDFNLSHVFFDLKLCQERLKTLSQRTLAKKFIAFPGCWKPATINDKIEVVDSIINDIHWRFCGGFFIGDRDSVIELQELYKTHFPYFLFKYRTLVWEVNFWTWLEATSHYRSPTRWSPHWFQGDHNNTIIQIPADLYSPCIGNMTEKTVYSYPVIPDFVPGSAAYVFYQGKHVLNTRYVNYTLTDRGYYLFNHPENRIITQNMNCVLDDETLFPIEAGWKIMENPTDEELHSSVCNFHGLEDMRLYEYNEEIRFIATSMNYSPTAGKARMIRGRYNIETMKLEDTVVIHPPTDTWCEKNWVPLIRRGSGGDGTPDEEWFVYKWSPFELGRIKDNTLVIEKSYSIGSPIFQQFRGSSIFTEWNGQLIGIVHFSENESPRHYYHCLVALDRDTFQPLKYSQTFCFEKVGIEFCIGMAIHQGKYRFWISQFDRDPLLVSVEIEKIPLCFDVV